MQHLLFLATWTQTDTYTLEAELILEIFYAVLFDEGVAYGERKRERRYVTYGFLISMSFVTQ